MRQNNTPERTISLFVIVFAVAALPFARATASPRDKPLTLSALSSPLSRGVGILTAPIPAAAGYREVAVKTSALLPRVWVSLYPFAAVFHNDWTLGELTAPGHNTTHCFPGTSAEQCGYVGLVMDLYPVLGVLPDFSLRFDMGVPYQVKQVNQYKCLSGTFTIQPGHVDWEGSLTCIVTMTQISAIFVIPPGETDNTVQMDIVYYSAGIKQLQQNLTLQIVHNYRYIPSVCK
jgi:hypothetical protein